MVESRLVHAERRRAELVGILAQRAGRRRRRRRRRLGRAGRAHGNAGRLGDHGREILVNVHQDLVHGAVAHDFVDHLVQLEGEGRGDVVLLPVAHAVPELGRLAEVIAEARAALAHLRPGLLRDRDRAERRGSGRRMHRAAAAQAVGKVGDAALLMVMRAKPSR